MTDKILLLSCCAPCSCAVIKTLADSGCNFAVAFYNPNIRPAAEYAKRLADNQRVCAHYHIPFIPFSYDHDLWCALTEGLHDLPERGQRCDICFFMRLKKVMEYARTHGFTCVASVLAASRHKDLAQVTRAAQRASADTGVPYLHIETRKNGQQTLRHNLIKELSLYQQSYCGCRPPA